MTSSRLLLSTALSAFVAAPALADQANDTMATSFNKELESLDVYFNSAREGLLMNLSVWDTLLYRDLDTGEFVGNLATSYEWIDDTTLEFQLREGVTFHNGEPFNADDVVATMNFIGDPANGVKNATITGFIEGGEKIEDFTVRVNLEMPFPAALDFLAGQIAIYPDEYYAEVGPQGMSANPVGTGPYRVASVEAGQRYVLEANEDYFDGPKSQPAIGTVDIRVIPDVNTQIAELFNGTLDFLWGVPADQAEQIDQMGRFEVVNAPTMRVGYLEMDAAGRSDPDGPMTDPLVRQAVFHAIDRQAIVDSLVRGSSEVINSACSPAQFGCAQDIEGYEYDPERARELLAEAGYPDGFSIDFSAYRDRPYAEAIMGFLNAVGIETTFDFPQYSTLRENRANGEVPMAFLTWGSNSIGDVSAIVSEFFSGSDLDVAQDPEIHEWLMTADTSTDPDVRRENYANALQKITQEAYWVPLFTYNTNYVFTDELEFEPTEDEVVRFYEMSWTDE